MLDRSFSPRRVLFPTYTSMSSLRAFFELALVTFVHDAAVDAHVHLFVRIVQGFKALQCLGVRARKDLPFFDVKEPSPDDVENRCKDGLGPVVLDLHLQKVK